ncbi:MAG: hypothetical protein WCJ39_09905 [bacterium]
MGQKAKVLKPKGNNQGKGKKKDRKVHYVKDGVNERIAKKHLGEEKDPNHVHKPPPIRGAKQHYRKTEW